MKKIGPNFLFLLCIASLNAVAGDLSIPNVFSAGTPARAAEINENFSAIEAAVDGGASAISDLDGRVTLLEAASSGWPRLVLEYVPTGEIFAVLYWVSPCYSAGSGYAGDYTCVDPGFSVGLSRKGFMIYGDKWGEMTRPAKLGNEYNQLRFENADCTGTGYVAYANFSDPVVVAAGLIAFSTWGQYPGLRYLPKRDSSQVGSITFQSYRHPGGPCTVYTSGGLRKDYGPVLPNDPDVTGVPTITDFDTQVRLSSRIP